MFSSLCSSPREPREFVEESECIPCPSRMSAPGHEHHLYRPGKEFYSMLYPALWESLHKSPNKKSNDPSHPQVGKIAVQALSREESLRI